MSACLVGFPCTYHGQHRLDRSLVNLVRSSGGIAVCPEQLAGLSTPRPPAEIRGGDGAGVLDGSAAVVNVCGADQTRQFVHGARLCLRLARTAGCRGAVLRDGSPSCGVGHIYDGSFSGTLRPGSGVAAELLIRSGIRVLTHDAWRSPREESARC